MCMHGPISYRGFGLCIIFLLPPGLRNVVVGLGLGLGLGLGIGIGLGIGLGAGVGV